MVSYPSLLMNTNGERPGRALMLIPEYNTVL